MGALPEWLSVGEVAARSGVAPSAVRFYESRGLIAARRTAGNQRRFHRSDLRRVAVIRAGQAVGMSLEAIGAALDSLPEGRTPNASDWERLAASWRRHLDRHIESLLRLRDELSGCIGCGCLSLDTCALFNADDRASVRGPCARYLLGDVPPDGG
jgi:MerR family transcriptional regulator, redox-sensitive transcriptional activator SoxR